MDDKQESRSTQDAWRELGDQFQELGKSLASAIRNTLETEENRRRLEELQKGVEKMAGEVSRAIDEAAESPEGKKAFEEMEKTAESVRVAGQQALEEARPHILSALKQANEELQKLIERLNRERRERETPGDEG